MAVSGDLIQKLRKAHRDFLDCRHIGEPDQFGPTKPAIILVSVQFRRIPEHGLHTRCGACTQATRPPPSIALR